MVAGVGAPASTCSVYLTAMVRRQIETGTSTEVWLLPTGAEEDGVAPSHAAAVLDDGERLAADRLLRPADRARSIAAHVALRVLVGRALGRSPARVVLGRADCPLCGDPHGRPIVVDGDGLEISLTHTAGLVAVALGTDVVGVDAEGSADAADPVDLDAAFHPEERTALAALSPGERPRAALSCWVRKEAHLKGLGTGLGLDPSSVRVGIGHGPAAGFAPGPPGWWLADVDAGPAHLAAVAVASGPGQPAPTLVARTTPIATVVSTAARAG